jgi:ABC-type lipoprotein export system ATPase subunit
MTQYAATTSTPPGGVDVRCDDVEQIYDIDGERVVVLHGIDATVATGEGVAVLGPSGSGKSTLTALLAGLRRPTGGRIWIGDRDLTRMTERQLLRLRRRLIGVVMQNPARTLLPYATAEDNILFAQSAAERRRRRRLPDPGQLLGELGLGGLAGDRAAHLSGGEQQRLSVAVAMAGAPRLLLADEPTSQLDTTSRDLVTELLVHITTHYGTTTIVVTHDPAVADAMHRTITLSEGRIIGHGTRRGFRGGTP